LGEKKKGSQQEGSEFAWKLALNKNLFRRPIERRRCSD
jgi:hypothetical protein